FGVFGQSYTMRDLGTSFQGYLCSEIGGANAGTSTGFGFDYSFLVNTKNCVDSLFICWFEGKCGIKPVTDVWGISSVTIAPSKAIKLTSGSATATVTVTLKNFTANPVTGTIDSYLYDYVTGDFVPGTHPVAPEVITLTANETQTKTFAYPLTDKGTTYSYQFFAKLSQLTNDLDLSNNSGSETFTVLKTQEALTVPDNNLFLVVLVAFSVLAIVGFKK
ncbi:MAG: hypothetical protein Q7K42_01955, partial [Candidatus Diapherotrites archaeon]|nr:hypothetical protein [Candidatus Diapherotrites archaeon]